MANVESGNWVMNAAEREQRRAIEAEETRRVATGGKAKIPAGKIIKTSLRALSIIRIIVAALTPGVSFIITYRRHLYCMTIERGIVLDNFCGFWSAANMDSGVDGCSKKETALTLTQKCTTKINGRYVEIMHLYHLYTVCTDNLEEFDKKRKGI